MSIKQLRAAIAPCCGLGANREKVDAALNNVSELLSTQEQLLVETLNILEHSLKAIRLDAVTEELLQNHYGAIKAIRGYLESRVVSEPIPSHQIYEYEWSSLHFNKLMEMAAQPGQLQLMPKAVPSQIDQVIHELFFTYWVGSLSYGPIKAQRSQLYKNLKDQLAGYWTGHTAYWILVNGGFIVDGPKGTAKQLTRFGSMFKEEMESINDAAQETRSHLQSQALQQTTSMVPVAQIEKSVEEHVAHFISLIRTVRVRELSQNGHWSFQCWPWSVGASVNSIERRIQAAIKSREFAKAQRLDNVKQALLFISNPIELGSMT